MRESPSVVKEQTQPRVARIHQTHAGFQTVGLSRLQAIALVLVTLSWGANWPIMKLGVTAYPPLTFRAISLAAGVPVLALVLLVLRIPFRIPRRHWPELLVLAATNMFIWHSCMILAVHALSSGRAAILGYTMPIFSALIGALFFAAPIRARGLLGVVAAGTGVALLLWQELTQLAGQPWAVGFALFAAATWALGTQLLRNTKIELPTLTLSFWMTVVAALGVGALAAGLESSLWRMPNLTETNALLFNAVIVFGIAHAAWFYVARGMPPAASTLSVMLVPVIGVFGGAYVLGEQLRWADWVAVSLMVLAIASVLWPSRDHK